MFEAATKGNCIPARIAIEAGVQWRNPDLWYQPKLDTIDDDYIDSIKLNISNGVAKIENLHPTYIESESESDSDTDSNSDIIFKLQCIIM